MIIDSKKYNKKCSCGKIHKMTTKKCIIEAGCLADTDTYIKDIGLSGYSVAVYDENTYYAQGLVKPNADKEIILPSKNLHADNTGTKMLLDLIPDDCNYLIAVGSGTIHDLTRYCAYAKKIPFVSCPTAASVDGFCSSVAAMTWYGFKKTFIAIAPALVIADLDVISKAPMFLTKSGFGDMIGKFIALAEWKISNLLTGEYFCPEIYDMTMSATKAVTDSANGIKNGDITAYEKLTYGLLMSGLAMQLLGSSRCASGAEHHISHFIEMQPSGVNISSSALHGEKVGVGTLLAAEIYHNLKDTLLSPTCADKLTDYITSEPKEIEKIFGERLKDSIIEENASDMCKGITADLINENRTEICNIIDEIPYISTLKEIYNLLELKSSLNDIGVSDDFKDNILKYSSLVRNRLTLMRLRRGMMIN